MPVFRIPGNGTYESTASGRGSKVVLIRDEGRMDLFRWRFAAILRRVATMVGRTSMMLARVANSIDKPLPA